MVSVRSVLLFFLSLGPLWAQDLSSHKPNIAVVDFTGDQTVSPEQLSFITGKMAAELVSTNQFIVLDRSRMDYILKEQGFQQSGACNSQQCQVQIGQLLGVDDLVSGTLVKFGPTYMIRIDYLDVQTGQIIKSVDVQKEGELYQIVKKLCHESVQMLVDSLGLGLKPQASANPLPLGPGSMENSHQVPADAIPQMQSKPLSTKRKIALALGGLSLAGVGMGVYFNQRGVSYRDDYNEANDAEDYAKLSSAYADADDMKTYRNTSYGISLGAAVAALVLWFLPEGGH
ncbi:MAG TPA: CsgG/HfaB family protein [Fibrobacteraceae bacterium]|nr:CsgG/HfaB family protein [Fibrobacteraceae bacterium]